MTRTIHVTTPCINAADTIDRTIMSVVSQAGDFHLRYHIQDGESTDGTLDRVEAWKHRLRSGSVPKQCHGIHLTYASEKDQGMYDALIKGFASLNALPDDFMTWINADDILMPGALALASALAQQFKNEQASWFGGAACIIKDDFITRTVDRPVPRDALQLGLCDGVHWDFLQQEGTFFRGWLWRAINPHESISKMKLAGDWNIWRLMAEKASFAQVSYPLGGFRVSDHQLSASQRDRYFAEIEDVLSLERRRASMEQFFEANAVVRRRIEAPDFRLSRLRIVEEPVHHYADQRYFKVFQKQPSKPSGVRLSKRILHEGKDIPRPPVDYRTEDLDKIDSFVRRSGQLIAFDKDWQFPAITEQHAFERLWTSLALTRSEFLYVAYPWATLIDKIHNKTPDAQSLLARFEEFCDLLPKTQKKVTVCQHIYAQRYKHLFSQASISHVFWSHATHDDIGQGAPYFHPFPLYPVQVTETFRESAPESDAQQRRYLFSFVGAKANQYYLTQARNWILDYLSNDRRGLILSRDGWHYEKVVYDHQIRGTADTGKLVETWATEQFVESLKQSTFSLCPSGSGPNSIRLWESIGAGAIPVVLADTWAPPGNARLWEMATVFCKEDPEEIKTLPERLAKIAADPEQLSQMRHAMRQIWLLYGPQSFVTDVQEFMLSHTEAPQDGVDTHGRAPLTWTVIDAALEAQDGKSLLRHCASALLLDPSVVLERIETDTHLGEALDKARKEQPPSSELLSHYDAVFTLAQRKVRLSNPAGPSIIRKSVPKVCLFGRHANRTPLSYAPIRRLIGQRLEFVESPVQADIVVSGFNIDLRDNLDTLLPLLTKTSPPKSVVLSEEPLWDITWSGPFTGREARISANGSEMAYTFLGHETSDIYEFERIPYFVLTSDSYAVRYANLMARFAVMKPKDMLDHWNRATVPAAFFLEKRTGGAYSGAFPDRDVFGLSAYRTEVAENTNAPGVLRVGKGWGNQARRQHLPDWHLDKLAQIDRRTRVLSAFENVHQRQYITEKIFDAFAVGAVPAYWAGPQHRIFDLIPECSMVNCHNLAAQEAADKIGNFVPDHAFAEAWLDTTARLASLFSDATAIQAERRRVVEAVLRGVDTVLDTPLVEDKKSARKLWNGIANISTPALNARKNAPIETAPNLSGRAMNDSLRLKPSFKERMDDRLARWYKGASPHTNPEKQERRKFLASLVNKSSMYAYISKLGLRLPKQFAESATSDGFYFRSLPSRVVIKPNNNADSKGVMLFDNGRELLSGDAVSLEDRSAYVARVCERDRVFDKPGTRLIAEEFVRDYDPSFPIPRDFKVFVAGGQAQLIQVIDRNPEKKLRTNSFFDRDWTFIEERIKNNYRMGPAYPRPPHLEALLADADLIARDIGVFYRLDFYLTATGPVFGEFTSYPSAGMSFTPFGDRLMCEMMDMDANPDVE